MTGVEMPEIPLKGGPYDGLTPDDRTKITGASFFPEFLVVLGSEGSTVYDLKRSEKGERYAEFSHFG